MDMETCAMAFRILRMHGYDVSSGITCTGLVRYGKYYNAPYAASKSATLD